MEKEVKLVVQGKNVVFYCVSRGTRHGFAHDARMLIDGLCKSEGHCYYLNRTWEHWVFQSACISACENLIDVLSGDLKDDFKHDRGLSRVCGKHKDELQEIIKNDPEIALLTAIKRELVDRCF